MSSQRPGQHPQPARRTAHDLIEGYGNIQPEQGGFEVKKKLLIILGPSETFPPNSSNKKVNGFYLHY